MANNRDKLLWELRAKGGLEKIREFLDETRLVRPDGLPDGYTVRDVAPFPPSGAVYFMNGYSDATVVLRETKEEIFLQFTDDNTSIAASAPLLYDLTVEGQETYVPVPPPLRPTTRYPQGTPEHYRALTSTLLLQVVSMNMRAPDGESRLLIGLPYAEARPDLFFSDRLGENTRENGASYGVVQSLTEFTDPFTGQRDVQANGYPARSFFAIYHLIETPVGTFFNKKATKMELQPDRAGKLALTLPPIPFEYSLINGPIPLFNVDDPDGPPVGDIRLAHHESSSASREPNDEVWPFARR